MCLSFLFIYTLLDGITFSYGETIIPIESEIRASMTLLGEFHNEVISPDEPKGMFRSDGACGHWSMYCSSHASTN